VRRTDGRRLREYSESTDRSGYPVGKIYFDARCKYRGDGRRATTNIRPVDYIGRPMGDLNVCTPHAEQFVARARSKNLEISIRD